MSKSPSLRRIQADVRELAMDPSDRYFAAPLEDDMFEWHFTIRGADGTDFEGGVYHGRILLPPEYPFKPPHIVFLTPSGRFETNTKICLSFSAFHPELWQPAWGIRLILEALISFLPTPADGAIGALDWTSQERKRLAKKSLSYCCPKCGKPEALLPKLNDLDQKKKCSKFEKEIEQLRMLQIANEAKTNEEGAAEGLEQEKKEEEEVSEATATVEQTNGKSTTVQNGEEVTAVSTSTNNDAEQNEPEDDEHEETENNDDPPPLEETPLTRPNPAATASPRRRRTTPAQEERVDTTNATPEPAAAAQPEGSTMEVSWFTDPMLHAIIVVLAVLCVLLMRKSMALAEELRALNSDEF